MAEYNRCKINYGLEVTPENSSIDFASVAAGPELNATLRVGLYSLTTLLTEVIRAMQEADPANTYTATASRSSTGNILTIGTTTAATLELRFATGSRVVSSAASLLGFPATDKTGATSHSGNTTAGNVIIPEFPPFDLQPVGTLTEAKRSVNETTSGRLEIVSFGTFENFEFKIRFLEEGGADFLAFQDLHRWLLRGGPIEFTENQNAPSAFNVGIPNMRSDEMKLRRQIPSFYDFFETPLYRFRELS